MKRFNLNSLEKLTYIGRRAMGAFEFEPESHQVQETGNLMIQKLAQIQGLVCEI